MVRHPVERVPLWELFNQARPGRFAKPVRLPGYPPRPETIFANHLQSRSGYHPRPEPIFAYHLQSQSGYPPVPKPSLQTICEAGPVTPPLTGTAYANRWKPAWFNSLTKGTRSTG